MVGELRLDTGKVDEGPSNRERTGPTFLESARWTARHCQLCLVELLDFQWASDGVTGSLFRRTLVFEVTSSWPTIHPECDRDERNFDVQRRYTAKRATAIWRGSKGD